MKEIRVKDEHVTISFSSVSPLADRVTKYIEKGILRQGSVLGIRVGERANNLLDLFALGRLIALCDELRRNYEINAVLADPDVRRRLMEAGLSPSPGTPTALGSVVAGKLQENRELARIVGPIWH